MPLTKQEARCIDLGCAFISGQFGGDWKPQSGPTLDELYPSKRSPEIIATDGQRTAAIEVKRLTGDSEWNDYRAYRRSLQRSLAPVGGGHYDLVPSIDFRLPMAPPMRRSIKRQIAALAESMRPGDSAAVMIPREAVISQSRDWGDGFFFCCHTSTGQDLAQAVSERIEGAFMLVDEGQREHEFVTDEGFRAAVDALVDACARRLHDGTATAQWQEEWALHRGEDGEGQVDLVVVTNARDVWAANAEAVDLVLDDALRKFTEQRWADLHVVVLDCDGIVLEPDLVIGAVRAYEAEVLETVDLILLADGNQILEAWRSPSLAER